VSPVLLEVDEPPGEDEDVPLVDDLGEELVGSGDEADLERALEHEDDLGGARVRVRRVLAARGVVDARDRDAQGVHAGELLHVGRRHHGARRVVGVAGVPETREEEVVRRNVRLAGEPIDLDRCALKWIRQLRQAQSQKSWQRSKSSLTYGMRSPRRRRPGACRGRRRGSGRRERARRRRPRRRRGGSSPWPTGL
jgi:hypothetical protein